MGKPLINRNVSVTIEPDDTPNPDNIGVSEQQVKAERNLWARHKAHVNYLKYLRRRRTQMEELALLFEEYGAGLPDARQEETSDWMTHYLVRDVGGRALCNATETPALWRFFNTLPAVVRGKRSELLSDLLRARLTESADCIPVGEVLAQVNGDRLQGFSKRYLREVLERVGFKVEARPHGPDNGAVLMVFAEWRD